jgi:hypothetical protein
LFALSPAGVSGRSVEPTDLLVTDQAAQLTGGSFIVVQLAF